MEDYKEKKPVVLRLLVKEETKMNEELKVIDALDEIPEEVLSAHEDCRGEEDEQ